MNCTECKERRAEGEKELAKVSKAGHELIVDTLKGIITKLWIALIIVVILLVGSNIAWIVYEAQFEEVTQTDIEQRTDGNGDNYVVGGDYNNDVSKSENNKIPHP